MTQLNRLIGMLVANTGLKVAFSDFGEGRVTAHIVGADHSMGTANTPEEALALAAARALASIYYRVQQGFLSLEDPGHGESEEAVEGGDETRSPSIPEQPEPLPFEDAVTRTGGSIRE